MIIFLLFFIFMVLVNIGKTMAQRDQRAEEEEAERFFNTPEQLHKQALAQIDLELWKKHKD